MPIYTKEICISMREMMALLEEMRISGKEMHVFT